MNQSTYHVPYIYEKLQMDKTENSKHSNPQISRLQMPPIRVKVPGSKSITNRALLLATLAKGQSTLRGVLFSDDSRHFLKCVQALGFDTTVDEKNCVITVNGQGGEVPLKEANQYVGSAGTAARFLTAYLGVSHGTYHMDASEQMRKRPMAPLLHSLKELGCEIVYPELTAPEPTAPDQSGTNSNTAPCNHEGYFPFDLHSHGFGKNSISIDINHSSQFLSALLIASCLSEHDFTIEVKGTHGMSYIEMTCKMMEQFGVRVEKPASHHFLTKAGQAYQALDYQIEPDVSAACYFYALAPLLGIPVLVEHVHFDSLQGDVAFLHILEQLGCTVSDTPDGIIVRGSASGSFHGIEADMAACSDQAITLAAIAPFADSPTTITGIGHIRFQECNRIQAIVTELTKMGIHCEESEHSITIYPGIPKPSLVETYDDHRMAMGFSLIGLRSAGIVINNPCCCSKTFENYFEVLEQVIGKLCN